MALCAGCDAELDGNPRRKWCSNACRCRAWARQYAKANGEAQSTTYRRAHGREQRIYPIVCERCGKSTRARRRDCRYCTQACAKAAQRDAAREAARLRPLRYPPVHVGPSAPRCDLPPGHPARQPEGPRPWWKFFIAGTCEWCAESFVARAASLETAARFCSTRCQRDAAKNRRGRFIIPGHVRRAIYERDGWICQLCDEPVYPNLPPTHRWAATLDHIVCRSWTDEPDDSPSNLRLAHRMCNSIRGDESRAA